MMASEREPNNRWDAAARRDADPEWNGGGT
jgi:hypothetical protein